MLDHTAGLVPSRDVQVDHVVQIMLWLKSEPHAFLHRAVTKKVSSPAWTEDIQSPMTQRGQLKCRMLTTVHDLRMKPNIFIETRHDSSKRRQRMSKL